VCKWDKKAYPGAKALDLFAGWGGPRLKPWVTWKQRQEQQQRQKQRQRHRQRQQQQQQQTYIDNGNDGTTATQQKHRREQGQQQTTTVYSFFDGDEYL
jgi:hypothetical protein